MKIACTGGGPAGLYAALLLKQADPSRAVTVFERNRADETFGWGVVFSDQSLDALRLADEPSYLEISDALEHWDAIDIHFRGEQIRSGGHGFGSLTRARLRDILTRRARSAGVDVRFGCGDLAVDPAAWDLVVAADGASSATRQAGASHFQPQSVPGTTRFIWLGADLRLDAFLFDFRETEWGWFTLHAYRHGADRATLIVETPETVWRAAGLD